MTLAEYKAVAIAGEAGTGKTTVAWAMGSLLGWEVFGAGGEFRGPRQQQGASIGAANGTDNEHDRIDGFMADLMRRGNAIVEGRVAGLVAVAHTLPGVMKVLLVCGAEKRYQRIWERDRGTYSGLDEVRTVTDQREGENLAVFSRRYGRSYLDGSIYDLTVNTEWSGLNLTVATIRQAMGR